MAPRIVRGRPSRLKGASRRCAIAARPLTREPPRPLRAYLHGQAQGPALRARGATEGGLTAMIGARSTWRSPAGPPRTARNDLHSSRTPSPLTRPVDRPRETRRGAPAQTRCAKATRSGDTASWRRRAPTRAGPRPAHKACLRGRRGSKVKGRAAIAKRRAAPLTLEGRPRTMRGAARRPGPRKQHRRRPSPGAATGSAHEEARRTPPRATHTLDGPRGTRRCAWVGESASAGCRSDASAGPSSGSGCTPPRGCPPDPASSPPAGACGST